MKKSIPTKPMYGNYKVYHPDGDLMFYCNKKRFNWYLKKGIARYNGNDKSIILTFEPKGKGEHKEFLYMERKNICVISGKTTDLTKHHVIPTQYRKYFPDKYKSKNSYDVVVLERKVHNKYERIADTLKEELFEKYITDNEKNINSKIKMLDRLQNVINKHFERIPMRKLRKILNQRNKLKKELLILGSINYELINYDKLIVERVGVENLILMWKKHFIEFGKPKFLPDWWESSYIKIINR